MMSQPRWLITVAVSLVVTIALPLTVRGSALVPRPSSVVRQACTLSLARPLVLDPGSVDPGGLMLLKERWHALGIPAPVVEQQRSSSVFGPGGFSVVIARDGYRLRVAQHAAAVFGATREARFDGLMTLAQLPERRNGAWVLPCVTIDDAPAMVWRIVSDDVSRGPFPTMAYAKERIRTLASLKFNGWSPYMEQVVVDPRSPYVATPNGWTTAQLHELAAYARQFYVRLIPEQQTFAHMHETLKWETYAQLAELPHGYLLSPTEFLTYAYLHGLVTAEVAATAPTPFVHLGADEPIDLGRGRTPRTAQIFATHVARVAAFLPAGVRPIIWDDAIQQDHTILPLLPTQTIVAAFHYGAESSYRQYLDPIANAGLNSMIAPGAANWNEIYPDLATSYANVSQFAADGRAMPNMAGMFMTVWHDDGESLYEATWPALAYAAANAWQAHPVNDATWHATFAAAFFGTNDPRYADALDRLRDIPTMLRTTPSDPPDYVFWHDPFADGIATRISADKLTAIRLSAETILTELSDARPPLHPQAIAVMRLAALRYDQLARRLQIGTEARAYYEDARSAAPNKPSGIVYRNLNVAKYLCWEMRDALTAIEPQYAAAWRYESTEPGLARVLVRYRIAEEDAQRCADRIDHVSREDFLRNGTVPPWEQLFGTAAP
jgi:hypothetical protein